jgi:xyloglucan-specific exo-beta-1,4-glucanase
MRRQLFGALAKAFRAKFVSGGVDPTSISARVTFFRRIRLGLPMLAFVGAELVADRGSRITFARIRSLLACFWERTLEDHYAAPVKPLTAGRSEEIPLQQLGRVGSRSGPSIKPRAPLGRYQLFLGRRSAMTSRARGQGFVHTAWLGTLLAVLSCSAQADALKAERYTWRNVEWGGGGYVNGIVAHPSTPNLLYIRTDVGGCYRWDAAGERWIPLLDWLPHSMQNLYGGESIAIDPSNPNNVYFAGGMFDWWRGGPWDVLKSTDQGKTWERTNLNVVMHGNDGDINGERLIVDPNDGNVLYFGSHNRGLWRSTNAAASWDRVTNFPKAIGISFVEIDRTTGAAGTASSTIYVAVRGSGIYRSTDAGASWALMAGSPLNPNRAAIASDGTLYVAHDAGVAKFSRGVWTNISPPQAARNYAAISVDPRDPNVVVTMEHHYGWYRSTNGGATWTFWNVRATSSVPWLPDTEFASSAAAMVIDPTNPKRVWFTDKGAVWRTDDITANLQIWRSYVKGLEEMVVFDVKSPPSGAPLLSAVADHIGFRNTSLTTPPLDEFGYTPFGNSTGIDFEEADPNFVVRVGHPGHTSPAGGYSTDNGRTFTAFLSNPDESLDGRVSVSATSRRIVWLPKGSVPYCSSDLGASWTKSAGAPPGAVEGADYWSKNKPLAADRVDGSKFYLYDYKSGRFFRSTDGAATFEHVSTIPSSGWKQQVVEAAPGMNGEVWLSNGPSGLYRSSNAGGTFAKVPNVQNAFMFSFGVPPRGSAVPTVFLYGAAEHTDGIFRSDDLGNTWILISDTSHRMSDLVNGAGSMAGDRQVWGRVYIGTDGRGVFYGEP